MQSIEIHPPTSKVLSKMVMGQNFRIKSGKGFNLGVDSARLKHIDKAFRRGAAHTLKLTGDEIQHNISGNGILGKKFDNLLKKHGGETLKTGVYKAGDALKPMVMQGIDAGIAAASMQVPMLAPAFLGAGGLAKQYLDKPSSFGVGGTNDTSKAGASVSGYLGQQAMNYLDNTPAGKYKNIYSDPYGSLNMLMDTNNGYMQRMSAGELYNSQLAQEYQNATQFARQQLYQSPVLTGGLNAPSVLLSTELRNPYSYNNETGFPVVQNMTGHNLASINVHPSNPNHMSNPLPLMQATLPPKTVAPAVATETSGKIATPATTNYEPWKVQQPPAQVYGMGLGTGLHHHAWKYVQDQMHPIRGLGVKRRSAKVVEKGSIGIHGNLLRSPQALISQPYSVNFMWSSTLPPSYQKFNDQP